MSDDERTGHERISWGQKLWYARMLPDEELRRHIIPGKHRCKKCFRCAALTVLEERQRAVRGSRHSQSNKS
jgi:hypothetical protein